jgi:hypothetical protein
MRAQCGRAEIGAIADRRDYRVRFVTKSRKPEPII